LHTFLISPVRATCHSHPIPSHPCQLNHPNNILWSVQVTRVSPKVSGLSR
jgi:hypothetical protein